METTFLLGRIAGIRIGLNWSVLVVAWIVCWSLSTAVFPEVVPGYEASEYWTAGAITSLFFFGSLLAHELGHSLVARHYGVNVNEITLWMLGGMAKLEDETEVAGEELRIALVGPGVSVSLAVLFGAVSAAADLGGTSDLVAAIPAWLATINLVLAAFNLIPAFPMDGGRVLRALLWRRHGDKLRATRTAASAGRGFGWFLVFSGLLVVTGGGGLGGLWFGLIGLFLLFASNAEASQVEQKALLEGVRISDVMTPDPVTAPADVTVQELLDRWILHHHVSAYPVVGPGGVEGLVTLAHVREVPPSQRALLRVRDIAAPVSEVPVADPAQRLVDLLPKLVTSPLRRALVMRAGRLVGIVSVTDISRTLEILALSRT